MAHESSQYLCNKDVTLLRNHGYKCNTNALLTNAARDGQIELRLFLLPSWPGRGSKRCFRMTPRQHASCSLDNTLKISDAVNEAGSVDPRRAWQRRCERRL